MYEYCEIGGPLIRFLRKPRWFSTNFEKVRTSMFQWGQGPGEQIGKEKKYPFTLSVLGVINGPLPKVGLVLVVDMADDGKASLKLKRKWW